MAKTVVDPWLLDASGNPHPFASTIDFSMRPEDEIDPDPVLEPHSGLEPEIVPTPVVPVADVIPEPVPDPEGPEVMDFDGGQATLEKEKGQWKLTVTSDQGGNPQVYWGKTKNELILGSLGKAQFNATKKIRELNRQVKLGGTPTPRLEPVVQPQTRELTSDEIFEIKTQLDSNPALAMETWFQKATGLSVQELVGYARQGSNASLELRAESINKVFTSRNPDYFSDEGYKNFSSLVKWVAKFKAGKIATDANAEQVFWELVASGIWAVENIEEAFEDLKSDGELLMAPKPSQQAPPVIVQQPEPVPAPRSDARIVQTVTRPRAALGIRPNDVTPVASPEAPKAPSVEDFENMSDAEIASALAAVRRQKILSRRSN